MMAGMGEEEAAGDVDDPFAMMAGMGEEEVYKVTLVEEKDSASQDQQKVDDSAGMQGAMAAEFLAQRDVEEKAAAKKVAKKNGQAAAQKNGQQTKAEGEAKVERELKLGGSPDKGSKADKR